MGAWLRDEKTERVYHLSNGEVRRVRNEYQEVICFDCREEATCGCKKKLYCRLTTIWAGSDCNLVQPALKEYHINHRADKAALKGLTVYYHTGKETPENAVTETEVNGKWVLMKGGHNFGEEKI